MTNWEKSFEYFVRINVGYFDVPKDILLYLNTKSNATKPANHRLVGHIKKEYDYINVPKEVQRFFISKCFQQPIKHHLDHINILNNPLPLNLDSLWINYQKKYEFNPVHEHSGLFSFIVFLKIPYDLNEEDKIFPTVNNKIHYSSRLGFATLLPSGRILSRALDVDKSFENKMIMFPAHYKHYVYPFYTSDDYRITVSGNINFKSNSDYKVNDDNNI